MSYDTWIREVMDATGLPREQAERATRAFLRTLSMRLGNDEARQLATQLPTELQDCFAPTEPDVVKLSRDDFVSRIAEEAGITPGQVRLTAQAVWAQARKTVSAGELADVQSQLPDEIAAVIEGVR